MAVFGESRSNQTARHPGLEPLLLSSRAVKVSAASCRSEPRIASSLLSREFISGRANGRFIQAEATGRPDLQISAASCNSLFSSAAEPSYFQQKLAQWPFYQWLALIARKRPMAVSSKQKQPASRFQPQVANPAQSMYQRPGQAIFIKAKASGWPDLQISETNCNFAIIPRNNLLADFQAKACPMAVLSTPGPMAVLTTGWLFLAKACPMAVLSTRCPMAVLSTPGPMAVLARQRQRMARPPDFSNKLQFHYYPAQSI